MDQLTRSFFEMKFKLRFFVEAKGDAFQVLFSRVMSMRFPGDFMAMRPWGSDGDRKNDGYLPSRRTLFQCYAPNDLTAVACVAKIEEDFAGALKYWKEHFDTWTFVHNTDALPPHVLSKLLVLGVQHFPVKVNHWGFEELRREAFQLTESDLADLLGPAPTQATLVRLGVSDLEPILCHICQQPPMQAPDLRPVPANKISHNQLSADAATLLTAGMTRADLLGKYFQRKAVERDRIAEAFGQKYASLKSEHLAPDDILMALQRFAGSGAADSTPSRETAILAVLAYLFEECDIFERPEGAS